MDRHARGFLVDNMLCMSAYWASAGTVIAALATYYGLPLALSTVITGLTSTLPIVQLWGGLQYSKTQQPRRFLLVANGAWRVVLPFVFFTVLLPQGLGRVFAPLLFFVAVAVFHFACPSQTEWMVGCVEGKAKADYYSVREMSFMLVYTLVFCGVNLLLNGAEQRGNLQPAFLCIGVLLTALILPSLRVLFRLPAPEQRASGKAQRHAFRAAFAQKGFRRVVSCSMLWSFSVMFVGSFSAIYQIGVLHVSFIQIMLWTTLANLARALFAPVMARLAARLGWRTVTCGCMLLYAVAALAWSGITRQNLWPLYPLACLLGGVPFAGINVGFLQLQVDTAPPQMRSICFSLVAACNGVAALAGSAVCSLLVQLAEGGAFQMTWIFWIGAVGAVVTALYTTRVPAGLKK